MPLRLSCFIVLLVLLIVPLRLVQAAEEGMEPAANIPAINAYRSVRHLKRPVSSPHERPSFNATFDFESQYIWRGIQSSTGAVWQPSASVEYHDFGFSVWLNFVMDNEANQGQVNEIDFTPYYAPTIGKLSIVAGLLGIVYPNGNRTSLDFGSHSLELDLHASYPVGPIDLFTDLKIRFISGPGSTYWGLGVGYQRPLAWNISVHTKFMIALGNDTFNRNYFGVSSTLLNQFEFSLSFPWQAFKGFTITPSMNVSTLLAPSLRRAAVKPDIVWGGGSFSYDF